MSESTLPPVVKPSVEWRPNLVMFDLDGTLVDSVPDLSAALDAALREHGLPEAGVELARTWVGNGSEMLVRRALGHVHSQTPEAVSDEQTTDVLASYFSHYKQISGASSVLYPGIREGLDRLRQEEIPCVVITNKPARFIDALLEKLSIAEYFKDAIGGDSLPEKKPDPAPLIHMLQRCGVVASEALMVGDSHNDLEAARAAGVASLAVTYGYNQGRSVNVEPATWYADHLDDFLRSWF